MESNASVLVFVGVQFILPKNSQRASTTRRPHCELRGPSGRNTTTRFGAGSSRRTSGTDQLHGDRFPPPALMYVSAWLREKREYFIEKRMSEQFKKAWRVSFPPELWPGEEEEDEDGTIFLKLKDGTKLLGYRPGYKRLQQNGTTAAGVTRINGLEPRGRTAKR